MNKIPELHIGAQVDSVMDMLDRYYSAEHYSKDDVPYTINNNINFSRVKLLLESLLGSGVTSISSSDYQLLISIFDNNCLQYMVGYIGLQGLSGDSTTIGYHFVVLYNSIAEIKRLNKRDRIITGMKNVLGQTLGSIEDIKRNIKLKTFSKNVVFISHYYPLGVIIEGTDNNQFIAQIEKNGKINVLYDFGVCTIEKYIFGDDNKLFIVKQQDTISSKDLSNIMNDYFKDYTIATLKDFFTFLYNEYKVDMLSREFFHDMLDMQLGDIHPKMLQDICMINANNANITLSKQRVLIYNNQKVFIDLGSFKHVEKPTAIKDDVYKGHPGISIHATSFGNSEKIIVTNGIDIDYFPLES